MVYTTSGCWISDSCAFRFAQYHGIVEQQSSQRACVPALRATPADSMVRPAGSGGPRYTHVAAYLHALHAAPHRSRHAFCVATSSHRTARKLGLAGWPPGLVFRICTLLSARAHPIRCATAWNQVAASPRRLARAVVGRGIYISSPRPEWQLVQHAANLPKLCPWGLHCLIPSCRPWICTPHKCTSKPWRLGLLGYTAVGRRRDGENMGRGPDMDAVYMPPAYSGGTTQPSGAARGKRRRMLLRTAEDPPVVIQPPYHPARLNSAAHCLTVGGGCGDDIITFDRLRGLPPGTGAVSVSP
ncbi:hypothetical protein EDC01DRAFT_104997 [Geopyxis carbonaria]|nr:hypothetical protein EDC01DRAFT_104997 [Geopyxis carbonaria]